MLFLYHTLWTLVVLSCVPLLPFRVGERIRTRLFPRLPAARPEPGCLWVHALSVGEVLSAVPLVHRLARRFPGRARVLTVTTTQGMAVARRELAGDVDLLMPMPLDFRPGVRRLVRFLRPSVFLPVETDLWPGLMHHLKRRGVPTLVVNGRISPRTAKGYRRFSPLSRILLHAPALWLMQSALDAERLVKSGVSRHRVRVAGNIKFDADWEPMEDAERTALLDALGLGPDAPVWVAGSTHPGEEESILDVHARLGERFPGLRLVLAPRRVERGEAIRALARARGFRAALRSGSTAGKRTARVVILDTLGELGRVYGIGAVAFVGGSLVPFGGHNLLEPARFGLPAVFGPHVHNFAAMSESLLEAGGGCCVQDAEDLEQWVGRLLSRPEEARRMGERALGFVRQSTGALDRVLAEIEVRQAHGV